eukprot:CAMPEP_0179101804 /NCGR_PEP_ID=MMETSP0796-20121207/47088_1 /TAXON_ID=73915 /ORGANISM="Pyrodinium bahamense, Strain pbaha01" /LENGTH=169 /DNA_ID=CAMNT_0020799665 /DNA_START=71 /DNA_END=580 /DNA_ORIENTATION=-
MGSACCAEEKSGKTLTVVQAAPLPSGRGPASARKGGEDDEEDSTAVASAGSPEVPSVATLRLRQADGLEADVVVTRRPLGIRFLRAVMPLTVASVRAESAGEQLKIQPGLAVVAINGERITDASFECAYKSLMGALSTVPEDGPGPSESASQSTCTPLRPSIGEVTGAG